MRLWRRRYRSAGIAVPASVHRLIARGNRARDAGRWAEAADYYAGALAAKPDLYHIAIQLGHALKEDGRLVEAEQAYRRVNTARPRDREGLLHLGHVLKLRGLFDQAAGQFAALAAADPDEEEAMREARDLLGRVDDVRRRELATLLAASLAPATIDDAADDYPPIEHCALVYDVSDLISFFSHARRPTGIQRVQLETLVHALERSRRGEQRSGVCCFIDGRDEWVAIPPASFLDLARLAVAQEADAATWQQRRDRLHLSLLLAPSLEFARGAALVNLGTSWWLQNYFLHVRDAQVRRGVTYIPMIHDMIPIMFPDFCTEALVQDFVTWAEGVFGHTNSFLAVSDSSKRDLIATAERMGCVVRDEDVRVVPLNADFSVAGADEAAVPAGIVPQGPFVLFVSTIEPRKGHLVAFEAWSLLLARLGAARTPRLLCVGRNGWRNAAVFERLACDPALRQRVTILSDLSDAALAALYDASLFTLYPSLYEGWGLPVTEALCRGKVVITTTSSSLPQAGGTFATFVPPGDAAALADAAQMMIVDDAARQARERAIVDHYRPDGWDDISRQIGAAAAALSRQAQEDDRRVARGRPPVAEAGRFYWLGRSHAADLQGEQDGGERFRAGLHWSVPDTQGCRIKRCGATLAMLPQEGFARAGERVIVTLRLVGSDEGACSFALRGGAEPVRGVLARRERRLVSVTGAVTAAGMVTVGIDGAIELVEESDTPLPARGNLVGVECFRLDPVAIAPARRRRTPPAASGGRVASVAGTVVAGHGVASGSSGDGRFPQGTIAAQYPRFRERGVDLAVMLGGSPLMGTINVDLAPLVPRVIEPEVALYHIVWSDHVPAENFWLFRAMLLVEDSHYSAILYMPDPSTKPEHFQPRSVVELIAAPIPGIAPGVRVGLAVDAQFVRFDESK